MDATLKNLPNKIGTPPQHIYTISTSCAIFQLCFVLGSCVHTRNVEGNGEGLPECVVHVDPVHIPV